MLKVEDNADKAGPLIIGPMVSNLVLNRFETASSCAGWGGFGEICVRSGAGWILETNLWFGFGVGSEELRGGLVQIRCGFCPVLTLTPTM
jgi:hypothetical protein